jgi:hypothetical protein
MKNKRYNGMLTGKRCPKCGGNLLLTSDIYGWSEQCLQCGKTIYLDVIYDKKSKTAKTETPVAAS